MDQEKAKSKEGKPEWAFLSPGIIILFLTRFCPFDSILSIAIGGSLWLVGISCMLYGCYIWATRKKRHWAFMLWGLIAPIGFIGIAVLKDKSEGDQLPTPEWKAESPNSKQSRPDYSS